MSTHETAHETAHEEAGDAPCHAEGVVAERVQDAGTRAERPEMVLVDDAGHATPVHVIGDNPYAPVTLRALIGQRVAASGTRRGDVLRVSPEQVRVVAGGGP